MLLKRIRLVGFKSFADETIIQPGDGITAIVGPNGCGKSNIVDAIRWVLGEKSGRALRGKSMEDVIFLGSESRKPAGMAEVEILFDNRDRTMHIDQDEFTVGRRIYLNSSSEYILNGKRTTRREIERVFMDTGIGKTAYSIMEQGRMSEILKASPEERRNLFDEAAGISRFKAERQEAMGRLSDTEQNLLRLNDILKGKKDELDHLERQARKTRQYLKLKEHLDRHDRNLRYINHNILEERHRKVEEKLRALLLRRDEIFGRIDEGEIKIQKMEEENLGQVEQMHRMDREFHQDLSRIESIQQNLARLKTEREERKQKQGVIEERKRAEEKIHTEIKGRVQAAMQLELDLDAEIKALQGSAEKLAGTIDQLQKELQESVQKEEANNRELQEIERDQARLLDELKDVTHELILELEAHKKTLDEREGRRKELREAIQKRLMQAEEILSLLHSRLGGADPGELRSLLEGLDPASVRGDFEEYESIDQEVRSFLFGKSGLLSRKEEMDRKMGSLQDRKEQLQKENTRLFEKRKLDTGSLEKEKNRRQEMELQIRDFQVRLESSAEVRESILSQQKESEERLRYYDSELKAILQDSERLETEEKNRTQELAEIKKNTERQTGAIDAIKKSIEKIRVEINKLRESSRKDREAIEKLLPEISEQERSAESIQVALTGLQEELYNDFQISLGELVSSCEKMDLRKEHEESEYRRIKGEIVALGQFNALAIEEQKRAQESYDQLLEQQKDIEEAKKNILSLLHEIDEKSKVRFIDTFEKIQANFAEVFQTLFNGGKSTLTLTDSQDPMNAGVDIMVQPPGKKNSSITLLSGGEQNMTAIALMFATYLVRPSPFCLLDEIDAPLDDNNVNRFLKMLDGFANRSQFMMITHNKLSMMRSQAIFGVTQEEPGISKIVSVKLKDEKDVASI